MIKQSIKMYEIKRMLLYAIFLHILNQSCQIRSIWLTRPPYTFCMTCISQTAIFGVLFWKVLSFSFSSKLKLHKIVPFYFLTFLLAFFTEICMLDFMVGHSGNTVLLFINCTMWISLNNIHMIWSFFFVFCINAKKTVA